MSISSGRIAEFLSRAQNINEKAKELEAVKPVLSTIRSSNNSPIYSKKPQLSPISHQSFTSTHEGTPVPAPRKFILSGALPTKKAISVPPKDKPYSKLPVTKEKTELPSGRNSISSELPQKKPEKTVTKEAQSEKDQEIAQKVKEIEGKGKKKLQKVVEIFKQEALKTDQKLMQLQQENRKLKEIVDCPQLPSIHDSIKTAKGVVELLSSEESDQKFTKELESLCNSFKRTRLLPTDLQKKISNWFDCLQIEPLEYSNFLSNISKKIVSEQKRRLKTEEETWRMIEHEEALIRELEQKISNAETLTRNTSCRIISEHDDFEDFELNRDQISVNLLKLVTKKNSVEKMFGN